MGLGASAERFGSNRPERTDERITFGEQLQRIAGAISGKVLLVGGIGGAMMIIGNLMTMVDAISEGRAGIAVYGPAVGLIFGVLLTSYFGYLANLRRKLQHSARPWP